MVTGDRWMEDYSPVTDHHSQFRCTPFARGPFRLRERTPRAPYQPLPRISSRGGMADAYGSGPYGETRGGSTPLVSSALVRLSTFTEYLCTFTKV